MPRLRSLGSVSRNSCKDQGRTARWQWKGALGALRSKHFLALLGFARICSPHMERCAPGLGAKIWIALLALAAVLILLHMTSAPDVVAAPTIAEMS